jgi:hypothetical protein
MGLARASLTHAGPLLHRAIQGLRRRGLLRRQIYI